IILFIDNQTNHLDLLGLGIAYGAEGPNRLSVSSIWEAMSAANWAQEFNINAVNYKHADCNGDGVVDEQDYNVIERNYGLSHDIPLPFQGTKGEVTDPPLYVDLEEAGLLTSGNSFVAPIQLGTINQPVEDIYGLAFTIRFDPEMIDPNTVDVEVGSSWMGNTDVDLMSIDRTLANEGKIQVAICRNDHENVSGSGTIAAFIGIIDNVGGKPSMEVSLHELVSLSHDESPVPLYLRSSVIDLATDIDEPGYYDLRIYPNPTEDYLNILNMGVEKVKQIRVYNAIGQMMIERFSIDQLEQVEVSTWAAGIYFIDIELDNRRIQSKFKVTRN
ncbi:MAG: T9SS type A sorting domain-containing protein, partial [Bacteroidota bacterium]